MMNVRAILWSRGLKTSQSSTCAPTDNVSRQNNYTNTYGGTVSSSRTQAQAITTSSHTTNHPPSFNPSTHTRVISRTNTSPIFHTSRHPCLHSPLPTNHPPSCLPSSHPTNQPPSFHPSTHTTNHTIINYSGHNKNHHFPISIYTPPNLSTR
jgi:hypothetical protein